jgi:mRNA-degrading endonuclease RelE of RelBE toxin-antitoxin system
MSWKVEVSNRANKQTRKLDKTVREILGLLVLDLVNYGPVRGNWKNYSKLADGSHHCHLNYRYVAVWRVSGPNQMEITYVGSREDAPY